jgi:hypothetical protein
MKFSSPRQLKDWINNVAKENKKTDLKSIRNAIRMKPKWRNTLL